MNTSAVQPVEPEVFYPETDGEPIAESTLQFEWIALIKGGLDSVFRDAADVFVAGDLFWYPVKGDPTTRVAPDVLVALGRPKGHRLSYRQWEEAGAPPQVVFEVRSPSNRAADLKEKFEFYQTFGVDEYYFYDPERNEFAAWLRRDGRLTPIAQLDGWVSPGLGIRFELSDERLTIRGPDGEVFRTYEELARGLDQAASELEAKTRLAEKERRRAELERRKAEDERSKAEAERLRAERLAAKLKELGVDFNE